MADGNEQLIVQLEARINNFERDMKKAAKTADDSFKQIEQGSTRATAALEKASGKNGTAVAQLTKQTGLARYEMVNLSRQVQDIGVSLASGQSPFTVLVQQGTQVGDIFANTQGTFKGFASQIASAVTPTRLLAGGLVAAGAGAVAAISYWKNFALTLDDTARAAGVTVETMAKLQAAASFKGVGSEDFAKGMAGLAAQLYQAKNNAGELREVLRVNGVTINDNADALEKVADLIANSANYQQKLNILQKAGLPTSAEFVRFMDQGAEGIRRAKDGVAEFGGAINDQLVRQAREFDEAWSRAWTNFGLEARSATVQAAGYLEGLSDRATKLLAKAVPGGLSTIGTNLLKAGKGTPLSQDTGELYGSLLKPGGGKPTVDPDAIRNVEQMTDAIRRQADQQKVEIAAQGLSISQGTALRALQEQLIDAKFRHIQISDETVKKLTAEAQVVGRLAQANAELALKQQVRFEREQLGRSESEQQVAERLRQIFGSDYASHMNDNIAAQIRFNDTLRTTKGLAESAVGGLVDDLMEGKSATEALANSFKNLEKQLLKMAANALLNAAFSALTGGIGGIFGSPVQIKHTGFGPGDPDGPTRLVNPAAFIGAPRFHSGIGAGELPAIIRKDESVLTPGQMKALGNMTRGGGDTTVIVNNAPAGTNANATTTRDATGNVRVEVWLQRQIEDQVSSMIDSGQSGINRTLERRYGVNPKL